MVVVVEGAVVVTAACQRLELPQSLRGFQHTSLPEICPCATERLGVVPLQGRVDPEGPWIAWADSMRPAPDTAWQVWEVVL